MDTDKMEILVGARGLQPGQELTVSRSAVLCALVWLMCGFVQFFYPSTEWDMAQPFDCNCGTASCCGRIPGAKNMTAAQLEGYWLSSHIRELKAEQTSLG